MPSIFTRIIHGEIPCHKVGEDERFLAFLDINPLREGHTLVIPKIEVDKFFDLPTDVLSGIMPFAQGVAQRIARVVPCDRVGVSVVGLEVPHAHVHLIPLDRVSDMDFNRPKLSVTPEQLAAIAERIRNV
ncbi:MAG: HIT family protein [Bacteroidetes bacterium]|jgi:histidine triad (HIT) family protein|nr:HIT family protein [Bacteroidota bacterium]MBX7129776.1 HIT family protein [Flavobacteriales bacterium]MCC6654078.1 HIT family protein [Flavobacteriales bacterium]HMU15163.1 HIT family protein [Flavobacteriales bacterium]HMW95972.1 HIT family protein [Flavobacteriales bacterium]